MLKRHGLHFSGVVLVSFFGGSGVAGLVGDRVFGGMTGQKNGFGKGASEAGVASGVAGPFSRPGLAIPCGVAPQQSPAPFRQAKPV